MDKEITHKELLTFSNLTSLEWEFVDLEAIESGEGPVAGEENEGDEYSTQINDLLTPEVFARRDAEGDIEEFVYMKDINSREIKQIEEGQREIKYQEKEAGLIEMRQEAGIAMEYLEKSAEGEEGEFIKNWEVVYAADNYKLVKDYIDTLQNFLAEFSDDIDPDDEPYPSREELEESNQTGRLIELGFKFAGGFLSVFADYVGLNGNVSKDIVKGMGKNLTKRVINEGIESFDSLPLEILGSVFLNADELNAETILSILNAGAGPIADQLQSNYEYDVEEIIKELKEDNMSEDELENLEDDIRKILEKELAVDIEQELCMEDTGFRVLVLKKDNQLVITYKGKRPEDNKALPKEFDYLQVLTGLLKYREEIDSETQITFTGYEGGGDLSFLNKFKVSIEL